MPWPAEIPIDFSATGDNIIVPGVAAVGVVPGARVRVFQLFLVVSEDTTLTVKDGAGIALTGPMEMVAHGSIVLDFVRGSREADQPWFTTSPGNAFIIAQSGTAQVSGRLYYTQGAEVAS